MGPLLRALQNVLDKHPKTDQTGEEILWDARTLLVEVQKELGHLTGEGPCLECGAQSWQIMQGENGERRSCCGTYLNAAA